MLATPIISFDASETPSTGARLRLRLMRSSLFSSTNSNQMNERLELKPVTTFGKLLKELLFTKTMGFQKECNVPSFDAQISVESLKSFTAKLGSIPQRQRHTLYLPPNPNHPDPWRARMDRARIQLLNAFQKDNRTQMQQAHEEICQCLHEHKMLDHQRVSRIHQGMTIPGYTRPKISRGSKNKKVIRNDHS